MKKIVWIGWGVLLLFLIVLLVPYIQNEQMIKRYERGILREDLLPKFSLTQPYVLPYNKGNFAFQNEAYDDAVSYYREALRKNPPRKKDCKIRINLALAMVTPLTPESVTPQNRDEVIEKLREAVHILTENGCASEDGFWHDFQAQKLMREILDYIEQLENEDSMQQEENEGNDEKEQPQSGGEQEQPQQGSDGTDARQKPETGEEEQARKEREKELEEAFDSMQQEGIYERNRNLETYENYGNFSFGNDRNW